MLAAMKSVPVSPVGLRSMGGIYLAGPNALISMSGMSITVPSGLT